MSFVSREQWGGKAARPPRVAFFDSIEFNEFWKRVTPANPQ
jgi:hypothetical protein